MRKVLILSVVLSSFLFAKTVTVHDDLTYDKANGWWWYEEIIEDEETKAKETIKFKMTPKEKKEFETKKTNNKLLKAMLYKIDEQNKINEKILKKLKYAFPNVTPEYTTNKKTGEKCKSNSSAECFVMPVIAEGQQIPVLKEYLRNPSPSNSKKWLQWQATYFNHANKVSLGARFAYLKDGSDAYPTSTRFSLGDNSGESYAEEVKFDREAKIIHSLRKKIGYVVFLGENPLFEETNNIIRNLSAYDQTYMNDMDVTFVFSSNETRDRALAKVKYLEDTQSYDLKNIINRKTTKVDKSLFKKYNIRMTPSVVAFYKDKSKNKYIWQIIETGDVSPNGLRIATMRFLNYNGIISEKEMNADKNWNSMSNKAKIPKTNDKEIYKDYLGGK
jgi:hypothetical protein